MAETLVKQNNKEDFIKYINDTLIGKGFTKDPEKEFWSLAKDIEVGGGVMVINGQRQETPGEMHHVVFMVEIFGDGEMKDEGKDNNQSFIEINFDLEDNGTLQQIGPTFCMFFDDNFLFNSVLNKIFGI